MSELGGRCCDTPGEIATSADSRKKKEGLDFSNPSC